MPTPLPTSGCFDANAHLLPIRVFYEDVDAAGIVYHANYLKFAERARTEAMRLLSLGHRDCKQEEGLVFVVRKAEVDYLSPARLDDALAVRTVFVSMGAAYIDARQAVMRGKEVLAKVFLRAVCTTATGRPARIPRHWRAAFEPLVIAEDQRPPPDRRHGTAAIGG